MFELGFTQLGIIGGAILGIGLYIMAEHDKYWGVWVSYVGLVVIGAGAAVHLQKVFAENDRAQIARTYLTMSFGAVLLESPQAGSVTAWVRIKNSGTSPAFGAKGWLKFVRGPSEQDHPFSASGEFENEVLMGPGQEFNLNTSQEISAPQFNSIVDKSSSFFVWGNVEYTDETKRPRHLRFKSIMNGQPDTIFVDGVRAIGWGLRPTKDGFDAN